MTNFNLATNSKIEKYQTILIKSKIRIAQLIAKIVLKQQSLNQVSQDIIKCVTEHNQI